MNRKFKYGLIIIAVLFFSGYLLSGKITHEEFDSNKWKNWTESEAEFSLRWDMMNSLRNKHQLNEKTKNQIIRLLGKPESQTKKEFSYYLGMAKSGIDTGTLTLEFDENGKVIKYYVTRS